MTPDEFHAHALGIRWEDLPKPVPGNRTARSTEPDRWIGTEHGTRGVPTDRYAELCSLAAEAEERNNNVSLDDYRAHAAYWARVTERWITDAQHWYIRYESMRRGSLIYAALLAVETIVLLLLAWGHYAG